MSGHLSANASWRLPVVLSLAIAISGCKPSHIDLNHCWNIGELKEGSAISGEAILTTSKFTRTLMSPVSCEGTSVIADTPLDSLKFRPEMQRDPTESAFFQAKVEGVVKGSQQGRPMVILSKVDNVSRVQPRWLKK